MQGTVATGLAVPKRKAGRPIERYDAEGVKNRERKATNLALPKEKRHKVGRRRSDDRRSERRFERIAEDAAVEEVAACRMDDRTRRESS